MTTTLTPAEEVRSIQIVSGRYAEEEDRLAAVPMVQTIACHYALDVHAGKTTLEHLTTWEGMRAAGDLFK